MLEDIYGLLPCLLWYTERKFVCRIFCINLTLYQAHFELRAFYKVNASLLSFEFVAEKYFAPFLFFILLPSSNEKLLKQKTNRVSNTILSLYLDLLKGKKMIKWVHFLNKNNFHTLHNLPHRSDGTI